MKRHLLIGVGIASLVLGGVGIFLPLLPTTPFLLLSASCFLRSSKRLYSWLVGHRLLGPYIENYLKLRAVPRRAKIASIAALWTTIGVTAVFFVERLPVRALLAAVAVGVTIHLARMRTLESVKAREASEAVPEPQSSAKTRCASS